MQVGRHGDNRPDRHTCQPQKAFLFSLCKERLKELCSPTEIRIQIKREHYCHNNVLGTFLISCVQVPCDISRGPSRIYVYHHSGHGVPDECKIKNSLFYAIFHKARYFLNILRNYSQPYILHVLAL